MLPLIIQAGDELPIYRQIIRQIVDAIASGRLAPGGRLPSHRELAEQLVIAPLTVKKAYDELERDGLIFTQRGQGTFIAAGAQAMTESEKIERLRPMIRRLVNEAHLSQIQIQHLIALIKDEHAELARERHVANATPDSRRKT